MVLGDMQAIHAGRVSGGGKCQPLVERGGDRAIRAFDVIEKSDFHAVLCLKWSRKASPARRRRTPQ
jgi:hypothetical protein